MDRGDVIEVLVDCGGVGEVPVIAGDLVAWAIQTSRPGGLRGWKGTLPEAGQWWRMTALMPGEGGGDMAKPEAGVNAIVEGLVNEVLLGEAEGGGGEPPRP
ncbi:hypothetical protein NL676_028898 [Syzygium grande]|nr:hypothetical protein NL676_028898 [Syzygium grande]